MPANTDSARQRPGLGTALRRIGPAVPILVFTLIVLVAMLVGSLRQARPDARGEEIALTQLLADADANRVTAATLLDHDGRIVARVEGREVWASYPTSDAATQGILDTLRRGRARVEVDQQTGKRQAVFLAQFVLPLLLLANLFGLLFVLGRSGSARDLLLFSRLLRGKREPDRRTMFADVAGAGAAVTELQEVVDYLQEPGRFTAMGALPPKGVLLVGPPGCGKTLLARAVAGEAGVPFLNISGSEFVESLVGVGAARVRDLFRQAMNQAPAIVFIDELDAAGRRRGAGVGGGHDEREQTLNELLVQLDGFSPTSGVVVMGATNRPDILDPALLRPGRFDRKVTVDLPDVDGRAAILAVHARGKRLAPDVDLADIARRTPGFSGADLASLLNEAALLAVRARKTTITDTELVEAIERVLAGPRQDVHRLELDELQRIAYHESGHALVAAAQRGPDSVPKVTITARGRHVGHLEVLQREDRVVIGRDRLLDELAVSLAGVAAEEIVFGEPSTLGEGDLERATELARRIVGRYGMTDAVGRIQVLEREQEIFLGRDYLASQHVSPSILEQVDAEVRRLLDQAERTAETALRSQRKQLDALADALMDREVLEGDELAALLKPPTRRSNRSQNRAD